MFEKYGLRALNPGATAPRTLFYALISLALSLALAGCASGSGAEKGADGSDEAVSGQPPTAEEDTPKPLPQGPEVEIGRAEDEEAAADSGGEAGAEADGGAFTRSEVDSFMKKGSAYALTLVDVKPARVDGSFQGFEITTMKTAAADVVQPHLQVGDVITHINGIRMERPDDYLNAWKLLSEINKIRVDYLRDGASEHAVWHIR